ncbi:KAP family P-loop NTPase fold protein [Tautonia sociabilis]|uniref:KAP NTPase domain-containing protein n=1 Tax=Tautonia sociabilis TaxID=2080755 RepID=A0A432MLL6_9BACT|nr:P-loop NTPase fold protein [Tautonia sociabilis]RUL87988.1 hypothetical protein TsocGM_09710 [Tautonia sociabilis]
MWSDNETDIDYLGLHHLVGAVTSIIRSERLLPTTIGIFGDWGSGKSSLLKMVESELRSDDGVLVLSFNGWVFEGYEDAKTALMGTIIDEIRGRRTLGLKAQEAAYRLLKRVNVLRVLGSLSKHAIAFAAGGPAGLAFATGADFVGMVKEAASKAKDIDPAELEKFFDEDPGQNLQRSVRDFRSDFEELLNETELKTLVVTIDDLDRCNPDTIIETLEAIKLFLFVPRTAFIIGADERLVKYAVRRRFPELPGERVEVGRDYLEKLVQFPVRVPPLSRCELETYMNLLFSSLAITDREHFDKARTAAVGCDDLAYLKVTFNYGIAKELFGEVPDDLGERLALSQRLAPVLAVGLSGNPRQCKRFLNTLLMRSGMAAARKIGLKDRVLAKLMLLEYFRPQSFKRLAELQAEQGGKPGELALLERTVRPQAVHQEPEADPVGVPGDDRGGGDGPRKAKAEVPAKRAAKPEKAPTAVEKPSQPDLGAEFQVWLSDPWLREWVESEPLLADENLGPYFFFSRDSLGPIGGAVQRMSPAAQELLNHLLGESEGVRMAALRRAGELNQAEAAAIFEALGAKVERDERDGASEALGVLMEWAGVRRELMGELLTLLGRMPEAALPLAIPPRVFGLTQGTDSEAAGNELLERWKANTSNPRLAKAAELQLGRK